MEETYFLIIGVCGNYPYVEPDSRMPFMLADQIKKVVSDFYNGEKK